MATEILDIIDTAVKIGLGALISGTATYYITSLKHTKEAEKEIRDRRLNAIEDATKHIDEYFNAFSKLISVISGAQKNKPNRETLDLTNKNDISTWKTIQEYDNTFCHTRDQKSFACSKLQLLDLTDIAESLTTLNDLDIEVRDFVMFEYKIPDNKTIDSWYAKIRVIKNKFYKSISEHYNA